MDPYELWIKFLKVTDRGKKLSDIIKFSSLKKYGLKAHSKQLLN